MTYLELCQRFVQELGIAGGGQNNPTAVTGQVGELLNVVNWIRAADLEINNQTRNWKYLWTEYSEALAVDDQEPPMPSNPRARAWCKLTFYLNRFGTNQRKLNWMSWTDMQNVLAEPNRPTHIAIKPDGQLRLNAPMDIAATLTAEYYKAPTEMTDNSDVPAMPEEYHRVILCRAAVIYGGREDAPEIVNHYEPEYIEILSNLEADQKPEREQEDDADAYAYVEQCIPGFELEGFNGYRP